MKHTKLLVVLPALVVCLAAADALAQSRGRAQGRAPRGGGSIGRAVPRVGGVRPTIIRPRIVGRVPYQPYYYPFQPGLTIGFYAGYGYGSPYGYPYYYGYPYTYPGYGYSYPGYGYSYPGYGYPPPPPGDITAQSGVEYGGLKIQGARHDAQVFVDGYYVGIADDFDGVAQQLNLEVGPHQIEIRVQGREPVAFDVNVTPGHTVTYHAEDR